MNVFKFPLQKVLDFRHIQLEVAEAGFRQQLAALAELDRARAEWEAAGIRAEVQVREYQPISSGDLTALAGFRLRVHGQEKQIAKKRDECQREAAVREKAMLEARRRCRLLEKLKERRLAEWRTASNKELEETASESFLARWK